MPSAGSTFSISDTIASGNGDRGIQILPSGSGNVTAVLKRIEVSGNASHGFIFDGTSSTGGSPVVGGCTIFPYDNPWNTRIDGYPLSAHSTTVLLPVSVQ